MSYLATRSTRIAPYYSNVVVQDFKTLMVFHFLD